MDDVKDRTKKKIGRGRRQERIRGVHPEEAVMHHSGGEGKDVQRGRDETSRLQAASPTRTQLATPSYARSSAHICASLLFAPIYIYIYMYV